MCSEFRGTLHVPEPGHGLSVWGDTEISTSQYRGALKRQRRCWRRNKSVRGIHQGYFLWGGICWLISTCPGVHFKFFFFAWRLAQSDYESREAVENFFLFFSLLQSKQNSIFESCFCLISLKCCNGMIWKRLVCVLRLPGYVFLCLHKACVFITVLSCRRLMHNKNSLSQFSSSHWDFVLLHEF